MLVQLSPQVLTHSSCDQESWHILVVGYASECVRAAVIAPRSWALSWRFKQGRALPSSCVGGRSTFSRGASLTVPCCVVLSNMVAHHRLQKVVKWQGSITRWKSQLVWLYQEATSPYSCLVVLVKPKLGVLPMPKERELHNDVTAKWSWGLSDGQDGLPQGGKSQDAQLQWEQEAWVCDAAWTLMVGKSSASHRQGLLGTQYFSRYLQYAIRKWGGLVCPLFQTFQRVVMAYMVIMHLEPRLWGSCMRQRGWLLPEVPWTHHGFDLELILVIQFRNLSLGQIFPIVTFIHMINICTFMKLWWITRNCSCVLCVSLEIWLGRGLQWSSFAWDFEL